MNRILGVLIALLVSVFAMAQETITITDADLGSDTYNWTSNNVYLLDGYVYLEDGGVLNIEAGTVIKGKTVPSNADGASALIITKGAMIMAEGTPDAPIIFTGELDDLTTTDDLTATDNQTWGGLIILGNSIVGEDGGTDVIEGIPSTEPRIQYGGDDPMDNSGVLKYVSIRHGGSVLGADNEINGLTLGGVGAGTEIDFVEVFASKDDGIEFFGGTVNVKHAVVAFVGDDCLDFDESYDGYVQYALTLQGDVAGFGDHAVEYDGSEATDLGPKTAGRIYNGTFIGAGLESVNGASRGLRLRNDGAVQFWNCIWTDVSDYVFRVEGSSLTRLAAGETAFANNIVWNFPAGGYVEGGEAAVFTALNAGNTLNSDPELAGISRMTDNGFDPRLSPGSIALTGAATPSEAGIELTPYRGAFNNSNNWAAGWTALSEYNYFGDIVEIDNTITDASIEAGETLTLTADTEWLLDGFVYVEEGATLIIEPGTVIKGKTVPTTGDATSALIITRDGKIMAEGTADAPIIFTSELDDLSVTNDLTAADNQAWGGVLILGNSIVGEDGGTDIIEGIPSTETRIAYGGNDPMDNSGVLTYVSIRHGGSVLGADNEINGLTLGGVGAGTKIDYIEVFANKDDGIELFGGTVNITHAVVGFVGDDAYDFDESWDGYLQFLFSIQGEGIGDHAIEYDGPESTDQEPKTTGRIYNGTFIGDPSNSSSKGGRFRLDAAVQVWNSIFTEVASYAYRFDDDARFAESAVASNIAFGFGELLNGNEPALFDVAEIDPQLAGISRMPNGGLDPRPDAGSPALFGAAIPEAAEAAKVPYRGAFGNAQNWALGWTAMDAYGYFGDIAEEAIVTIKDADIEAGETLTLTADNEWLLDGYVYVEEGATLFIEPGTVIKGKTVPSTGDLASALIIAKGGKIMAEGTADAPIIFTGELDNLATTDDLLPTDNQTWGGLIILGNSIVGEDGGTDVIEGIPSTEPRIQYGGNDPMDNSGVLTYVSIRHGGSVLGADNEINGLTLGGVGAGTLIDYIEVFANKDDGIEFFGGTVNVTHAVVSFAGDDAYDFDESWDGYLQFLFSLQGGGIGDHAIEYDGSEATDQSPMTTGRIYNGTFIGEPANASSKGARFRNSAAAQVWNSIFTEVASYAYRFDDNSRAAASAVAGNIAFGFGELLNGNEPALFDVAEIDPQLGGISRMADGGLDPRPNVASPVLFGATIPEAEEAAKVPYQGAFGNAQNWAEGWTALSQYGFFGDLAEQGVVTIKDSDIEAGETLTLTPDSEWLLDGFVYVEEGATLNIEPGTIIKGKTVPSTGDNSSSLIIARGAKIMAEGTADAPIIFTGELDNLAITDDLLATDNQTWGGLIILGNSIVGEDGGTDVIEGIPSDEPRIIYGGDDPMDDSGILKYVSIRHGGSVLGADNEINGLTLGGVGAGTTLDFIEVFANKDDGIEFFGGTVNLTHGVVAFVGDDSYDFDESWEGTLQFVFSIQGGGIGDHAIEYDGSEATDQTPKVTGKIYNGTFIGDGSMTKGGRFRNDAAAQVWNSIFAEMGSYAYRFDDNGRFAESAVAANIAFNNGELLNGNEPALFDVTEIDPQFGGIAYDATGGLDLRNNAGSPALGGALYGEGDNVEQVFYRGAFGCDNWAMGWTAMSQYGYFGDLASCSVSTTDVEEDGFNLNTYPNPVDVATATVSFELPEASDVTIKLYDITGQVVRALNFGRVLAGDKTAVLNVEGLFTGIYVVAVETAAGTVTQKINVVNRQ